MQNKHGQMPDNFQEELYKWALECKYLFLLYIMWCVLYETVSALTKVRIYCMGHKFGLITLVLVTPTWLTDFVLLNYYCHFIGIYFCSEPKLF